MRPLSFQAETKLKKTLLAQVMFEDQLDNDKLLHLTLFEEAIIKLATFSGQNLEINETSPVQRQSDIFMSSKLKLFNIAADCPRNE